MHKYLRALLRALLGAFTAPVLLASAAFSSPITALAQNYPDRPIRLVVPTAAGGASDIVARVLAEKLRVSLGQPVIVDIRPGANGNVGAMFVLKEPADGYTILVGHTGLMSVNSHVYTDVSFDPLKDFAPIIWSVAFDNVLVAHPDVPARNAADLIGYAKANPKLLMYGTPGYGTSVHMSMEMFKLQAGVNIEHVPYKGMAPAMLDVLAGRVAVAFIDPLTALPHLKAGKLRALGVSNSHRSIYLPDVPTIAESGLPSFAVQGWNGIVAKAGTPRDRIEKLNLHLNMALKSPEVIKALADNGAEIKGGTPEDFGNFVRSEYKRWGEVVQKAKLPKV